MGIPAQAFARLSAVYGGTYMLSKPDAQVAYENGVAVGVTADGETAKAKLVVGDPSYFPDKVQKTSRVGVILVPSPFAEHSDFGCTVWHSTSV